MDYFFLESYYVYLGKSVLANTINQLIPGIFEFFVILTESLI